MAVSFIALSAIAVVVAVVIMFVAGGRDRKDDP